MTTPTDPTTREDPDLASYVARLEAAGIRRVVLRRTAEHRPIPGTNIVPLAKLRRCELLAYRDAVLYRCILEGADGPEVARTLAQHGLQVHLADGNIT